MPSWSAVARRIRVPLGFAFAILYFVLARPTPGSILIGSLLVIPGLLIRALASGHVQKNEQLTTGGPYRYTRNPLYLGSIIMAVGFAVSARSLWIAAALVILFAAIYLPVIRSEEAFLRSRFPDFEAYAGRVPRLIPRFRPTPEGAGVFSWNLYLQHREYNALIGAAAMTVALAGKLIWMGR